MQNYSFISHYVYMCVHLHRTHDMKKRIKAKDRFFICLIHYILLHYDYMAMACFDDDVITLLLLSTVYHIYYENI